MKLFQKLKLDAPEGVIPSGSTVQGVYCLTPDGKFLSGYFAWASRHRAQEVIQDGWNEFQTRLMKSREKPRQMPIDKIDPSLGGASEVKLEVAIRDFPRGPESTETDPQWLQHAYNVKWLDLSRGDIDSLVTSKEEKTRVPFSVLNKFSIALKDFVRGQCFDWKKNAAKEGELFTECIAHRASSLTMRITGRASFREPDKSYDCQIHGFLIYDTIAERLTRFDLVASGQRRGSCRFNLRDDDAKVAPMGVAFILHETKHQDPIRVEGTLAINDGPSGGRRLTLARSFARDEVSRWASIYETATDEGGSFALRVGAHPLDDSVAMGFAPGELLSLLVHDSEDPSGRAYEQNYVYRHDFVIGDAKRSLSLNVETSDVTLRLRCHCGAPLAFQPLIYRVDGPHWRPITLIGSENLPALNEPISVEECTFHLLPGEYIIQLSSLGSHIREGSKGEKRVVIEQGKNMNVTINLGDTSHGEPSRTERNE